MGRPAPHAQRSFGVLDGAQFASTSGTSYPCVGRAVTIVRCSERGLSDERTVERVTMVHRQSGHREAKSAFEPEHVKAAQQHVFTQVTRD